MTKSAKDTELIDRLLDGDASALEQIIAKYQTKIFNTAYKIVKNRNDAQEITQDVFFTVYRKIDTFKGNSSLYTWLYRITVNYAFMKLRSRRKETHIPIHEVQQEGEENYFATILPDKSKFADEVIVEREFLTRVLQSMEELPDKYRRVFQLRDLQHYSNEEVGEMLHLSVAAVKSRIHRARLFLRERMQDFATLN